MAMIEQVDNSNKARILIVEDNATNLKLFRDVLLNAGFDVCAIEDGHQALEVAKEFKPHLVLLDIQLNNISGIDVLKQLKSLDILALIPIAAVTAFAMEEDRENFLAEGFDHYISKPISISLFLQEVKELLESKKPLGQISEWK